MEQLVDIVQFLHTEIHNAFGTADTQTPVKSNRQNLGEAGLALHYANIITQIDTLVTHSGSVSPHTRDSLYQGLPRNIKLAIRSKLHWFHPKEEKFRITTITSPVTTITSPVTTSSPRSIST
ncbi:hypothetical protein Hdeb2414_s0352g00874171 [Helianthus debilis subsp. tardiflorus]